MLTVVRTQFLMTLFFAGTVAAQGIVGLPGAHRDVFVAVRGLVPAGAIISGVEFVSNDATVFPEVCLMDEARSGRLPAPGRVLRSVLSPAGSAGVMTVSWEPYVTQSEKPLWAVIRFPDDVPFVGRGVGGGPAIGWRSERVLTGERSLFSVGGALNEFSPAFDMRLIDVGSLSQVKAQAPDRKQQSERVEPLRVIGVRVGNAGEVAIALEVGVGAIELDIFDVAGRRVFAQRAEVHGGGIEQLTWDGRDHQGRTSPSGVYIYTVRHAAVARSGKFVRIR